MDEFKQLHKKGMQLQLSSVWLPRKQRKWKKKNHKSFPVLIHMKPTYNMNKITTPSTLILFNFLRNQTIKELKAQKMYPKKKQSN